MATVVSPNSGALGPNQVCVALAFGKSTVTRALRVWRGLLHSELADNFLLHKNNIQAVAKFHRTTDLPSLILCNPSTPFSNFVFDKCSD